VSNPIAYAFKRRSGRHVVQCAACSQVEPAELNVHDTDEHRTRYGDGCAITCQTCGKRLDGDVELRIKPEEIPVLRYALEHALSSISEAHAEDRAQLRVLIERLEAATRPAKGRS
jgi:hypothetical protein